MEDQIFLVSSECDAGRLLIRAMESGSEEELEKMKKSQELLYLHNEVAKLVKHIKLLKKTDNSDSSDIC